MARRDSAAALSPQMAARYGIRPTSRWLILAIAVIGAAFVGVLGWITWRMATPPVQSELLSFRVVNASRVDITFNVRRDTGSETVCVLRARDELHVDVGYATVNISAGRDYVLSTYPLATLARATSAEILGCDKGAAPFVDAPSFAPGTVNPPQLASIDGS